MNTPALHVGVVEQLLESKSTRPMVFSKPTLALNCMLPSAGACLTADGEEGYVVICKQTSNEGLKIFACTYIPIVWKYVTPLQYK